MPETIYASKYEKQALDEGSLVISVKDPDPQNPHVLGPQGSGSGTISQRYHTCPDPDPAPDPSLFWKMLTK
jgi:hypothetical protein